jgi:hypothetical protein
LVVPSAWTWTLYVILGPRSSRSISPTIPSVFNIVIPEGPDAIGVVVAKEEGVGVCAVDNSGVKKNSAEKRHPEDSERWIGNPYKQGVFTCILSFPGKKLQSSTKGPTPGQY